MKNFILPLAVALIATPAWATVAITVVDEGDCTAAINYAVSGEPNKARAFALDITVDTGVIEEISGYMKGEGPGFGIFPASFRDYITVDATTGEVTTWDVNEYTPLADPNDPGALGGLGTDGVTIELGGLWYPTGDSSPNAAPDTGTLCKLKVSEGCNMSVVENATRGGIVLTDPAVAPTVDMSGATNVSVPCGGGPCIDPSWSTYNDWVALGEPACWCEPYQCDGDVDGGTETFFKYRVYGNDLAAIVDNWKRKIDDPALDPCADIDHKSETFFKYRVYGNDLATVVGNWKAKDGDLPGDCPRPE
jgi:hypothetical protein